MWGSGDYASVASLTVPMAEWLCEEADLRAGDRVLDVACGSGNAALAAARRGCEVTGLDCVPELLDRARERATRDGYDVILVQGDAEALPFADAIFDRVLSALGVMFAPDQEQAAAELQRVCRPGGTIALASWTPESFLGELMSLVGNYVPHPGEDRPATEWGTEARVRELLADVAALGAERHQFTLRFRTPEGLADFFIMRHGPTLQAVHALEPARRARFREEFVELVRAHDDEVPGSVAVVAEYLLVLAER